MDRKLEELRREIREEIGRLRSDMRGEIQQLRAEIMQFRGELSSYLRWTVGLIIAMWTTTLILLLLKNTRSYLRAL